MAFQKGHIPWHKGRKLGPLSEEHRRKISAALKGRPKSDRAKRSMSRAARGRVFSDEHKHNISQGRKGIVPWNKGEKTGPLTEEHKRKISAGNKGKRYGPETRCRISEALKDAWASGVYDGRKANPPQASYNGIRMRSRWEARLAAVFDTLGWAWEYEPRKFQYELADGPHTYTPDFYVSYVDCYFDPHGDWRALPQKFDAVREQCGITLVVLDESLLAMYEQVASLTK